MFPSAGYFRSTDCPFFVHGLCHRPYCHFRHGKPGPAAGKSSTLNIKSLKGTSSQGECSKTGDGASKVKISFYSNNIDDESPTKPSDDSSAKMHIKEPKGILKKTENKSSTSKGIRENTKGKLPAYVPTSKEFSVNVTGQPATSVEPHCDSKSYDDDVELTDLTEEEKSIVFTGISKSVKRSKIASSTKQESLTAGEIGLPNKSRETSSHSFVSSISGDVSKTTEITDVVILDRDESSKALVKNFTNAGAHKVENGNAKGKEQMEVFAEKANKKSPEMDQTHTSKLTTEVEDAVQRRSQKKDKRRLSSLVSAEEIEKKRKPASKGNPEETSVLSPEKKDVVKHSKGEKERLKGSTSAVSNNDRKPKSKNKVVALSNVDFFSVPSTSTQSKVSDKLKCKGSPSKKKKGIQSGKSVTRSEEKETKVKIGGNSRSNKHNKRENTEFDSDDKVSKFPVYIGSPKPKRFKTGIDESVLAVDDQPINVDVSPVFSDSDSEDETSDSPGEAELKKIFNEYQPHQVQGLSKQRTAPARGSQASGSRHFDSDPVTPKKEDSIADKLGLGKKSRVAHNPSYLPRRLSANANPVRRYPKILTATKQGTPPSPACQPHPSSSTHPGGLATASHKPIKRRIAHTPKKTDKATLPRPRIFVEYGAKVPQNQRQRYLDRIVDEFLRLCTSQKEAYAKALEEENSIYNRATRRQVYINLCINSIKKLRNEPSLDNSAAVTGLPEEAQDPDSTTNHTATTPTKAAIKGDGVQSTVSPSGSAEMTEDSLYENLTKYLLDEDELKENCYPRPSPTIPGTAVIAGRKPQRVMKDPTRRICRRCRKEFVIFEDGTYQRKEQCVYHYGRLWKRRIAGEIVASYSCCQGDGESTGCCVGEAHVSENIDSDDGFMTTIVSSLADKRKKVFGLDCEMCYTTAGLELTRATVVDWKLDKVYDTFVKPDRPIVDYNTRFSGVTEEHLRDVNTSLRDVQAVLLSIIHKDSILVGHSLESDLIAVKLIHSNVVDTSVVFPHRRGPPYKRALRTLMGEHLLKIIQDGVEGHDSFEDAAAAVELMRWKVKEDNKVKARNRTGSR